MNCRWPNNRVFFVLPLLPYRVMEDIPIGGYSVTWWTKARGTPVDDRITGFSVSTATLEPAIAEAIATGFSFGASARQISCCFLPTVSMKRGRDFNTPSGNQSSKPRLSRTDFLTSKTMLSSRFLQGFARFHKFQGGEMVY